MHIVRFGLLFAILTAGCVASPSKIKPSYVSDAPYRTMSCEDLSAERGRIAEALTQACHTQRNARGNDIAGVIVLGLPVGSICGQNMTADIRDLLIKGKRQHIVCDKRDLQ